MILSYRDRKTQILFLLLILSLIANLALYWLPIQLLPNPSEAVGVVAGSLIDFVIFMPILLMMISRKKGFAFKRMIVCMVLGVVVARLVIPAAYFQPFTPVTNAVIAVEAIILLGEAWLILVFLKHTPGIISDVKKDGNGPLFAFSESAEKNVRSHPLIKVICAEATMLYYAFVSWKKRPIKSENRFTLHKKTSLIPLQIMLIHAIIFETVAIHWWLHDVSLILSIVLLILNLYSVLFFIGDIQALRLNPIIVEEKQMRLSLGLGKRVIIPYDAIEHMSWGTESASVNVKDKDILEFIALNIEEGKPHCVITLKTPLKAILFMGINKNYSRVAIRVDEPGKFRNYVEAKVTDYQN